MSEDIIYSDNNVSISTSRIVIGATTYALRNITSVKMSFTPAKSGCAIALIVLGAIVLLASLGGGNGAGSAVMGLLVGAVIAGGGVLWMRSNKTEYNVMIASSSGEAKALSSTNKSQIETIVGAINDAIIKYR